MKESKSCDLVVTRHPALIKYLQEIGLAEKDTQVISHASKEEVKGKHVVGVLPYFLSCLTESYTEVPLHLPLELRGKELTLEQVRKYAQEPVTYDVKKIYRRQYL